MRIDPSLMNFTAENDSYRAVRVTAVVVAENATFEEAGRWLANLFSGFSAEFIIRSIPKLVLADHDIYLDFLVATSRNSGEFQKIITTELLRAEAAIVAACIVV